MYKKILVTLDGSELSECVLPHVEALRKGFPECELIFLRVVRDMESNLEGIRHTSEIIKPEQWQAREDSLKYGAEDYLKRVLERIDPDGKAPVRSAVLVGRVEDSILDYADTENVDLILMATHGRSGVRRWVMGSVAEKVVRSSSVPVILVRPQGNSG